MKIIKPISMKNAILILGLVSLTFFASAFKTDDIKKVVNEENCYKPSKIVTVLTLEESQKLSSVPFIGNSFIGFREAVGFKESRSRYHVVNKFGYMGKYQFGKSTLKRLRIYNVENFLKDPEQQERAFKALCSLNKHILRKDIKRSVGQSINGIEITESGILAAAHLSGAGNVKKYLRSNGQNNLSDAFGSSIEYYMTKFSGFDVSHVNANKNPII